MHYKFIVEVLEKIMRRMEMIDHSFERKFYGACYRLSYKLARVPSLTIFYTFIFNKMHDNFNCKTYSLSISASPIH